MERGIIINHFNMKKSKCVSHWIGFVLVIIGGLNWGLVGIFEWNLLEWLLGGWEWLLRLVYILIGLAALYMIIGCHCKQCKEGACKCEEPKEAAKVEEPAAPASGME